jgi:NAD(P)-dependent dehydrogenase (short-subunit alcohol dehydrogenase family)
MLLEDRTAIVYGGAIGAAVAGGFAREGARVYLAGRNIAALDGTARNIRAAGWIAEPAAHYNMSTVAADACSRVAALARLTGLQQHLRKRKYGGAHTRRPA